MERKRKVAQKKLEELVEEKRRSGSQMIDEEWTDFCRQFTEYYRASGGEKVLANGRKDRNAGWKVIGDILSEQFGYKLEKSQEAELGPGCKKKYGYRIAGPFSDELQEGIG